jgi:hypothetical protein
MSALQSPEIDRLRELFARGDLDNAEEIAALLTIELGDTPSISIDDNVQAHLAMLCGVANKL